MKTLIITSALCLSFASFASMNDLKKFKSTFPGSATISKCTVCHATTPALNVFGQAYKDGGREYSDAFLALDSDGDGVTNGVEIKASTFPGDKDSH